MALNFFLSYVILKDYRGGLMGGLKEILKNNSGAYSGGTSHPRVSVRDRVW